MLRILYNSKDEHYKKPFGTIVPGQSCSINIRIPHHCLTKEVRFLLKREDGSEYASYGMERTGADTEYADYSISFALAKPGLFFYYFYMNIF